MGGVVRRGLPAPDSERVVLSAGRSTPRPGDIVIIECGKHAGTVAQVTGQLWERDGTRYTVCDVKGFCFGRFEASELTIIA